MSALFRSLYGISADKMSQLAALSGLSLLNVTTICYLAGPTDYYMRVADKVHFNRSSIFMGPLPQWSSGSFFKEMSKCTLHAYSHDITDGTVCEIEFSQKYFRTKSKLRIIPSKTEPRENYKSYRAKQEYDTSTP